MPRLLLLAIWNTPSWFSGDRQKLPRDLRERLTPRSGLAQGSALLCLRVYNDLPPDQDLAVLLRWHAQSLRELWLCLPTPTWEEPFVSSKLQGLLRGFASLRRLVLNRPGTHFHQNRACRMQLRALRRLLPNAIVICHECVQSALAAPSMRGNV